MAAPARKRSSIVEVNTFVGGAASSSSKGVEVCVFGSLSMDYFCYVENQPQIGQTIHAHSFQKGFGGKGANQCVMAARLGVNTAMVGKVIRVQYYIIVYM